MTPRQFIDKWVGRGFGERQAAQTWFLDRDAAGTGLVLDGQLVRDFWRP